MEISVSVQGVDEILRAFRRFDHELPKEIHLALREIGLKLAAVARQIAEAEGFGPPGRSGRGTGALERKVGVRVSGTRGMLVDNANRDGFYYPVVYEFGHGRERSFLTPAVVANEAMISHDLDELLSRLIERYGFA